MIGRVTTVAQGLDAMTGLGEGFFPLCERRPLEKRENQWEGQISVEELPEEAAQSSAL